MYNPPNSDKPEITIGCVSNIWSRQMTFVKKGHIEQGHKHNYDHLTLLAHGSLKVTVDDISTIFIAPHMIYISKDKTHELESLEDNTVAYCIHALRDADKSGDILDPSMIPTGVTPTNFEPFTPKPDTLRFRAEE